MNLFKVTVTSFFFRGKLMTFKKLNWLRIAGILFNISIFIRSLPKRHSIIKHNECGSHLADSFCPHEMSCFSFHTKSSVRYDILHHVKRTFPWNSYYGLRLNNIYIHEKNKLWGTHTQFHQNRNRFQVRGPHKTNANSPIHVVSAIPTYNGVRTKTVNNLDKWMFGVFC